MSKNLATTTVAVAPTPATSGATLTVATGTGGRLFAGQAVLHPSGAVPTPANAEVVTITDVTGDVVTMTRAQESSAPRTVVVGDTLTQGITAAMYDALVAASTATVPLTRGGTGATTASAARTALGLGTAATSAATAFAPVAAVTTALGSPSTATTGTLVAGQMALADATSAALARTLPAANSVPAGTVTGVKKIDGSANTVTVSRAGADTITGTVAGQTSRALTLAGESVEFTSDGASVWVVTSTDTPSPALTATYAPLPSGTPTVGQVPVVSTVSPLAFGYGSLSQSSKGMKRDYAAAGNMKVVTDATVTAASTALSSPSAAFVVGDVGKTVAIPYAGADNGVAVVGETHMTTIAAYVSGTQVTLAAAPVKSITGPRTITDAAINANSATLTSATANWTAADIGKTISVPNAGRALVGATTSPLVAKIVTRVSATQVTVYPPASTTVSAKTVAIPGAWVGYGTDDTAAFQAAAAAGGSIEIEPGRYMTTAQITQGSRTTWWGYGAGRSIVNLCGTGGSTFVYGGPTQIEDVTFRDFEIDGSGVRAKSYATVNKGLYVVDCKRMTVTGMYIHDTSATAVGCDYLPDSYFVGNVVERGGAQVPEFGGGGGGSGFGIGTGKYAIEAFYIAGNVVRWCGQNGIFTESQSNTIRSRGARILGNYVEDCGFGISDRACDGTIIANNQVVGIIGVGIHVGQGFSAPLNSINTRISDNTVYGVAIQIQPRDGDHAVKGNVVIGAGVAGIQVEAASGGALGTVVIEDNQVQDGLSASRGIWIRNAVTWSRILIQRNRIKNNSTSAALRPAVVSESSAAAMYVKDNIIWDDRGVSSGMSYGLQLTGGTITRLVYDGNDILGAATAADDLTGATITTQVTHFNP